MNNQITDTILMIRPVAFQRNEQTAVNNLFQPRNDIMPEKTSQEKALEEFDQMVAMLRKENIEVLVYSDDEANTPDSIFPNNWNSFHENGIVYLYPMFAENRREERREDILKDIAKRNDVMLRVKTFEHFEKEGKYLEGTGSLILDRINNVAYASISDRTHPDVLTEFAKETGFRIISFTACQSYDGQRLPIYHTNVMMCLGEKFSVICADCIDDEKEKKEVLDSLQNTGKELILISEDQRDQFAGNMLQVRNKKGERFVVMSEAAYQSLDKGQIKQLEKHGKILHTPIPTIEKLGGGSVRCMMGEVFIPVK